MELTFSHHCPINTALSSNGKPRYVVLSSHKLRRTTTIYRARERSSEGAEKPVIEAGEEVARIHWRIFSTSRLVYGGQLHDLNQFIPRDSFFGKQRHFKGPDGRIYQWKMGWFGSQLTLEDGSIPPTLVARVHRTNIWKPSCKPVLEVEDIGIPILDLIVITAVYIEQLRKRKPKKGVSRHVSKPVDVANVTSVATA